MERWMWQEDGEEDVRSYWMTLRTGEDTLIWKRRLWIALCGGILLEEALDLSSDRILNKIRYSWTKATYNKCHYMTLWSVLITIFYRQAGYIASPLYCTACSVELRPNCITADGIGKCLLSFVRFWPNLEWWLRFSQGLKKFIFIKHSSPHVQLIY